MKIPRLKLRRNAHWILIATLMLIYVLWKIYVTYTPNPLDDSLPDHVKDAVMIMVYDENSDPFEKPPKGYDKDEDVLDEDGFYA